MSSIEDPVASASKKPPIHAECSICRAASAPFCTAGRDGTTEAIASFSKRVSFRPKDRLFGPGDIADTIYVIRSGVVGLSKNLSRNRRQVVRFALPGDVFGLEDDGERHHEAVAMKHVDACILDKGKLDLVAAADNGLLRAMLTKASHDLTIAHKHHVALGRMTAEERMASFLMEMRRRWKRRNMHDVTIPLPMRRQDIADHLGLTIETVSRIFGKFALQKLIVVIPDGVRLLDCKKIEEMSGT
jgi:CRP/FNR family transcriptional regulator